MKEVIYQDTIYSEETVQKISDLRHERWAILTIMSTHTARRNGFVFSAGEMQRFEKRLMVVKSELFELTQNPIYND